MTDFPDYIAFEIKQPLIKFTAALMSPNFRATIDLDCVLSHVVDAIKKVANYEEELNTLAFWYMDGDGLSSHPEPYTHQEKETIYAIIMNFGRLFSEKLQEGKFYRNGIFPYQYNSLLSSDTILLKKCLPNAAVNNVTHSAENTFSVSFDYSNFKRYEQTLVLTESILNKVFPANSR